MDVLKKTYCRKNKCDILELFIYLFYKQKQDTFLTNLGGVSRYHKYWAKFYHFVLIFIDVHANQPKYKCSAIRYLILV